jgi:predicted phosphodiesterase
VLAELRILVPDVIVFGGDLSWGPLPRETLELARPLQNAVFVRGNAERRLLECELTLEPPGPELTEREVWMVSQHSAVDFRFLETFLPEIVIDIDGLGSVRFCHGSPRSDEECVSPATPEARIGALIADVPERVLVTAHVHVQFDRLVAGIRSVNAGSVGMPYEERRGAYWAMIGPDVDLRRTDYDLGAAVRLYQATDDPLRDRMVEVLLAPPAREEVIAYAEEVEFGG